MSEDESSISVKYRGTSGKHRYEDTFDIVISPKDGAGLILVP